jgi:hypothetical protein
VEEILALRPLLSLSLSSKVKDLLWLNLHLPPNKIKKKIPVVNDPIDLDESMPEEKSKIKANKVPFMPSKLKTKTGMQPINLPINDPIQERPKKPQGPSKLLELQSQVKNRQFEEPAQKEDNKQSSDYDDSFENYAEDDFESDDDKRDIKKALKHENRKAMKFQAKNIVKQNERENKFMTSNGFENSGDNSRSNSKPRLKTPEGGFAKSRGIVVNKKRVDRGNVNKQFERVENLKPLVQIEIEEYVLKPASNQEIGGMMYFSKLQTNKIHNKVVQSNDD